LMACLYAWSAGGTFAIQRPARLRRAGFIPEMHRTRQIITAVMAVLGVLLIARGVWGGVWPISLQLIAGVLLLGYAVLRWRYRL
jgi:hypothetical protein